MALIVQKFGGTSVANPTRIKEIFPLIKLEKERGNQLIIIVSAMAGVTNHLVTLCNEISSLNYDNQLAEYDVALCSGEMVTAALLALQLQEEGISARSILAWQLPILTNYNHSKALVEAISTNILMQCINQDIIPIIAGFQGITSSGRLTTLGRGGSDTTASLIASIMKADRCDIYTDVEGVFTADPRIVPKAQKLTQVTFEEMLEFASSGAKVLHPRSVEVALKYRIPMRVLSSFSIKSGTLITSKDNIMENRLITGITSNKNLLKISINNPKISFNHICNLMVINNIHIELMLNMKIDKQYNFITQLSDKNRLENLLVNLQNNNQIVNFTFDTKIAIISIIGYGIKNDPSIIVKILEQLEKDCILVTMIQISEIKVSILIEDTDTEKTIRNLHQLFELDK